MSIIKKLLLLALLFTHHSVLAQNFMDSLFNKDSSAEDEKVLYISYEDTPKSVIEGAISKFTIKAISITKNYDDIEYEFAPSNEIKIITQKPERRVDGKYIYDTFYFTAKGESVKFPKITASLLSKTDIDFAPSELDGFDIKVTKLPSNKNFASIVADSFDIAEYKTTNFDNENNIVVFIATAKNCDIGSLKLKNITKQGIESLTQSQLDSRITYYAIVNKNLSNLTFSYFNTLSNKFVDVIIPIVVVDDSVTTQSDLKPQDQSHQEIKLIIAIALMLFAITMVFIKRQKIYILLFLALAGFVIYTIFQSDKICVEASSNVYLLPTSNATVFEKIETQTTLQKIGSRDGWSKVELPNQKIGWIKDEDNCKN